MRVLDTLLEKCTDDAQRVTMLREALDIAEKELTAEKADHYQTMKHWAGMHDRLVGVIAKARRLMRGPGSMGPILRSQKQFADVYRALDTRARR